MPPSDASAPGSIGKNRPVAASTGSSPSRCGLRQPGLSACTAPAARRTSCRPAQPARRWAPTRLLRLSVGRWAGDLRFGTASLMWGDVLLAAETGEALPPGLAFDADGNPTQDGR